MLKCAAAAALGWERGIGILTEADHGDPARRPRRQPDSARGLEVARRNFFPRSAPATTLDPVANSKTIGPAGVAAAVEQLASAIDQQHTASSALVLLGVANGGVALAGELGRRLRHARRHIAVGTIDISFHRDDIGRHPIPKEFQPTYIPRDINGATVILVDDVLFSGRTIKAALDELFDHGRPAKVELAVLVDRGGRRLPITADYTGLTVFAEEREKVVVTLDSARPRTWSVRVIPASPSK